MEHQTLMILPKEKRRMRRKRRRSNRRKRGGGGGARGGGGEAGGGAAAGRATAASAHPCFVGVVAPTSADSVAGVPGCVDGTDGELPLACAEASHLEQAINRVQSKSIWALHSLAASLQMSRLVPPPLSLYPGHRLPKPWNLSVESRATDKTCRVEGA